MGRNEAQLLARLTWFIGIMVFVIGFLINRDALVIAAGMAIAGGIVAIGLTNGARS